MSSDKIRILSFPKIHDRRGNLSFIENNKHIPYKIKRVYYLYDVPFGSSRGGHAHTNLKQTLIALSGSFSVNVETGNGECKTFHLNNPTEGLYLPTMTWRTIDNFSSGSICLVLASEPYDEKEYIRNYKEFKKLINR